MGNVILSVHCHNDLGLAVANSLAAVRAGAGRWNARYNGIGERAGNASLEEIVMILKARKEAFGLAYRHSDGEDLPYQQVGQRPSQEFPSNPIRRSWAQTHSLMNRESTQDGIIKEKNNVRDHGPESVGIAKTSLVLGKHSGRHAFGSVSRRWATI